MSSTYPDQLLQALSIVDVADLLTEKPVQDLGGGPCQRCRDGHHDLRDVDGLRSYCKSVPGTNGLGCDLTKDNDGERGTDDSDQTRRQTVQQNSERGIDKYIAQQNAAQEVVTVIAHRLNFGRVLPLFFRARVLQNL